MRMARRARSLFTRRINRRGPWFILFPLLAAKLAHLPGKLAGGVSQTDYMYKAQGVAWATISRLFRAAPFRTGSRLTIAAIPRPREWTTCPQYYACSRKRASRCRRVEILSPRNPLSLPFSSTGSDISHRAGGCSVTDEVWLGKYISKPKMSIGKGPQLGLGCSKLAK